MGLLDRELLVVTGKGGVGKTAVAAALGLAGVRAGRRTVVVEVSGRNELAALVPGVEHLSIDPERAMEHYLADQLGSRAAVEVLVRSKAFTYLVAAAPGLRELLVMGHVWDLAQQDRRTGGDPYDLVVLDAPATGHGLALLAAPRTIADTAMVGRIERQARTIDAMLTDPARTGVVAVARAEELPVTEALELQAARPAQLVVCNAVRPRRFSAADAEALGRATPSRPVRVALDAARRQRDEQAQLARLRRGSPAPVRTLPWLPGGADAERLARELGL